MKCIIKLYSKETNQHTNTMMLCGTGSGRFDNHDTYQWVSYPYGTIYPEIFKTKEEALKYFDNQEKVYYEIIRGCIMTLIKENGEYTTATAPIDLKKFASNKEKKRND